MLRSSSAACRGSPPGSVPSKAEYPSLSGACPLLTTAVAAGSRSRGWNAAPSLPATQWTGQCPPWPLKWDDVTGCQSREAKIAEPVAA